MAPRSGTTDQNERGGGEFVRILCELSNGGVCAWFVRRDEGPPVAPRVGLDVESLPLPASSNRPGSAHPRRRMEPRFARSAAFGPGPTFVLSIDPYPSGAELDGRRRDRVEELVVEFEAEAGCCRDRDVAVFDGDRIDDDVAGVEPGRGADVAWQREAR